MKYKFEIKSFFINNPFASDSSEEASIDKIEDLNFSSNENKLLKEILK